MININEYKIAYDDFNNKLGVNNDFQLCTSNLLLLLFLQYIQNLYLEKWKNINIFFIRQNRLKSWNYQIRLNTWTWSHRWKICQKMV